MVIRICVSTGGRVPPFRFPHNRARPHGGRALCALPTGRVALRSGPHHPNASGLMANPGLIARSTPRHGRADPVQRETTCHRRNGDVLISRTKRPGVACRGFSRIAINGRAVVTRYLQKQSEQEDDGEWDTQQPEQRSATKTSRHPLVFSGPVVTQNASTGFRRGPPAA